MNKIKLTINKPLTNTRKGSQISEGTYFIGKILDYIDEAFLKGYDRILSLDRGGQWDNDVTVNDYQECSVVTQLTPIV